MWSKCTRPFLVFSLFPTSARPGNEASGDEPGARLMSYKIGRYVAVSETLSFPTCERKRFSAVM